MKNSKWIRLLSIALFLGMISGMITGCKKGDTGPEGPQGPAGPDSVYSSPWITDLSPTYVPDDTLYELIPPLSAPSITQGILDSGIVLSYVNFGSGTNYDVVPVSALSFILQEDFLVGSIYLASLEDFSNLPYRYVTIPGSLIQGNRTTGTVKGHTIEELKKMPYEQAQQVLRNQ